MDKRILEASSDRYGSYIFPFLWCHGESHEIMYEEILAIKNSGIDMFCAESRPHNEFCREQWWEDFGFILETAESLGMKIWLLDDKRFPSGYANGALEREENAHLRQRLIRERQADVAGPERGAKIFVSPWLKEGEKIESIIAFHRSDSEEGLDPDSAVDLTHLLDDGCVYWDIPDGVWRVCILINTFQNHSHKRLNFYTDMLNEDSCRIIIDEIYEPHYRHFAKYFGNVFCGFFSDEPGFYNYSDMYVSQRLGVMYESLPYNNKLLSDMASTARVSEDELRCLIPGLWEDIGEKTSLIRWAYMEAVSVAMRRNYSMQLGNWCRSHGVMYIGHIIEDTNSHMKIGCGGGHYFRSLDGCDMAGIDTVLLQNIPGITDCVHRAPIANKGYAHPDFFNYTLPKLAASHAHLQPLKKGRAMCEIFGAYGWCEGLPYMKQLADLMLASGINHFVPHAFSPKRNDRDCPPHFYNGGTNPQYPLFRKLMRYMSRTAHILSGGIHVADVAVFYNAEGEWTGGKNKLFQSVCARLTRDLIDFDIVPYDMLADAEVKGGRLCINGESFGALIVSESEVMPRNVLEAFYRLAKNGLPVIFTDSLPARSTDGGDISDFNAEFMMIAENGLCSLLREMGLCSVSAVSGDGTHLRYYHIRRDGGDVYMFSNEDVKRDLEITLSLGHSGEYFVYDAMIGEKYKASAENGRIELHLDVGGAVIAAFGWDIPDGTPPMPRLGKKKEIDIPFDITLTDSETGEETLYARRSPLIDVTAPDRCPRFMGSALYSGSFEWDGKSAVLDLGQVGETAELWLNGRYVGSRICPPYRFDVKTALRKGANSIRVRVCGNPGHRMRDGFSAYYMSPATGILGPITLIEKE